MLHITILIEIEIATLCEINYWQKMLDKPTCMFIYLFTSISNLMLIYLGALVVSIC